MSERRYLTIEEALHVHRLQIASKGGASGVRDPGQLSAAVFRPQSGYYPDLIAEAAALWESLSQNHPFVDGNKRTAFTSAGLFLGINGLRIEATADQATEFILGMYERGDFAFDKLDTWLRANTASR